MASGLPAEGKAVGGDFEASRAVLFEARGQYREAEMAYQRASDYKRAGIPI